MRFSAIGISHWKSEVSIRELFFIDQQRREFLEYNTKNIPGGVIILDTCNRTELYGFCDPDILITALCKATNTEAVFLKENGYSYSEDDAYQHLFKVGVGLDSQVLGDVQIIQQLKKAYKESQEALSGEFHQLMQSVFRAHKRVRTETDFGRGMASVGFVATQLALGHFQDLSDVNILLLGAGKMGKVTCKNLVSNGAQHISVINRTIEKAQSLASSFDIEAHTFEELNEEVRKSDLIIAATGATIPILRKEHFKDDGKVRLILDLSVPRNVESNVSEIDDVTLVDMDSIHLSNKEAIENRKKSIPRVEEIINEQLDSFEKTRERNNYMLPRIKEIDHHLSSITDHELDRIKNKVDDDAFNIIEKLTGRIKKKVMAIHVNNIEKELKELQNEA
ncbi:MAG: glutamyl-tRNA reductase [Balneola sp.]